MKPTGLFAILAVTALLLTTNADGSSNGLHRAALDIRAVILPTARPTNTQPNTKPATTQTPTTQTPTVTTPKTPTSTEPTTTAEDPTTTPTTTQAPATTADQPTTSSQALVTITSTSTITPLGNTMIPTFGAMSGLPSLPSAVANNGATLNQNGQSDTLTGSTASDGGKTIIIVVSCIGGVIVAAGVATAAFKLKRSREVRDDEEILRDGKGNFVGGDPFKSTLDQYHRTH